MTRSSPKMVRFTLRHIIRRRVLVLRRCLRQFWDKILMCSLGKPIRYQMLPYATVTSTSPSPPLAQPPVVAPDLHFGLENVTPTRRNAQININIDSDLVSLKIGLLGDCHTGKTSFLEKYVGDDREQKAMQKNGLNLMDKTLLLEGARISYSIWEVDGDYAKSKDQLPMACKDSVAILFMFDLTSRVTLKSVITWYQQARKWNQTAIPIMIGTKFDDFIQLPIDLQWTIASQARAYAKALNATLFFSSATYNINVNKIFKFITARLFDLPWTVERNLTIGEPIIDF